MLVAAACGGSCLSKEHFMVTASNGIRRRLSAKLWRGVVAGALCTALTGWAIPAAAQATKDAQATKEKIPELASVSFAWLSAGGFLDPPPGSGHGPIKQDPDVAFLGNNQGPGQVTPPMGNYKDPVLKPWAAAQMRASNEEYLEGKRGLPFSAQGRCYPGGVPGQLLYPAEPFYFIQTPKEVWMIWQRDHMVRRIYLTDRHSEGVKPSWFGESIGHYENGELVIDTIGLSTKNSFIDNFRTPHSEKEHVIERYKISDDGRMLEAMVTVDDPDTFNEPLHMIKRWRKVNNPMLETVCAENNGDHFSKNLFPIPQADEPDF
jgi:hypothetical protein